MQDKLARIRVQLTPKSLLFRHAIRLSLTLGIGYALIQLLIWRMATGFC